MERKDGSSERIEFWNVNLAIHISNENLDGENIIIV